jgi:hypothetical protein
MWIQKILKMPLLKKEERKKKKSYLVWDVKNFYEFFFFTKSDNNDMGKKTYFSPSKNI